MWRGWSLRAKIVGLTAAAVLPVMAMTTALTVRLSRSALEEDLRTGGLALAREMAASAVARRGTDGEALLQQEVRSLVGRGSPVRDVAVYAVGPEGLVERAHAGKPDPSDVNEEVAAREGQEIVVVKGEAPSRLWRVTVPIWEGRRSVGAVSLALPLARADALVQRLEYQAVLLGVIAITVLVGALSVFMNRAVATPLGGILQVMGRAEGGDLNARALEDRRDEVGQVARGLNRMLERVASFQAELARRVSDATAQLRATNERLYAAQQQVGRNERLAAAGELAAAMAHNVGTPLTGVAGHLQLLEEEVTDPAVKDRLRRIQGQVDRAVAAARQFLDAARPASLRIPVDVKALLEDLLILASPETQRKGIVVAPAFAEQLPTIPADPNQLQELFLSLITNALEAMENGGTLRVIAEAGQSDEGRPVIRVVLGDTGPGIPQEHLARIFEPFFTTRSSSGGTGLGLAIARRITRDHGGSIRLESEPGQGTRAIVELPVRVDQQGAEEPAFPQAAQKGSDARRRHPSSGWVPGAE
jgi:two-component system NtrC family sensor kinase